MVFFADWYDYEGSSKYPEYKLVTGYHIDRRNADSPDKIPYYQKYPDMVQKDWYSTGKNHRIVNGKIEKDSEEMNFYVIELIVKLCIFKCFFQIIDNIFCTFNSNR